jgi:hypothetical protein
MISERIPHRRRIHQGWNPEAHQQHDCEEASVSAILLPHIFIREFSPQGI